jgi:sugar lactone lactonase YvrE
MRAPSQTPASPRFSALSAVAFAAFISLLAGCGTGGGNISVNPPITKAPVTSACTGTTVTRKPGPTGSTNYAGTTISGKVLAGTATPMIGTSVQLYAAGTTGLRSAPTSLGSAVTTDTTGAFTISASYTCPSSLSLLYLVARGGKPGATGTANSGAVMMTALGTCASVNAVTGLVLNEATTVASAYAFAQFLAPGGVMGATATNVSGLTLAAATEANLVNVKTGVAPGAGFPAIGTAPNANVNTLANALNACVTNAAKCTALYAATTVSGTAPANTLDAALAIARNPANNVAAVFTASTAATTFAPTLVAAPTDWTLFANFSIINDGSQSSPSQLGIDSTGNVWVANYFQKTSLFSNTGNPLFTGGYITGSGLNDSYGLAVDAGDNAWVTNEQSVYGANGGNGTVSQFNTAGQPLSGSNGFTAGGLNYPVSVAFDTTGNAWVVDYGNSHVTILSPSGAALSGTSGYVSPQFQFPVVIAVDDRCIGYLGNQSTNTITQFRLDGTGFTSFVTGAGPSGIAVDANDNVWVANYYGSSVGLLSAAGNVISSGFTGNAVNHPQGVAIDGAGSAWIANYRAPYITVLAGANATNPGAVLTPDTGFGKDAALLEAFGIAIDASGNVWVSNFGNNTLTEFVGLAVPVRTPLLGPVATP